jgi:hypothetical protein
MGPRRRARQRGWPHARSAAAAAARRAAMRTSKGKVEHPGCDARAGREVLHHCMQVVAADDGVGDGYAGEHRHLERQQRPLAGAAAEDVARQLLVAVEAHPEAAAVGDLSVRVGEFVHVH